MNAEIELELVVASRDEATVGEVEDSLGSVVAQRYPPSRTDPMTILGVVAAAVQLVNALLELQKRLASRRDAPPVSVRNEQGDEVDLATASRSDLERLTARPA